MDAKKPAIVVALGGKPSMGDDDEAPDSGGSHDDMMASAMDEFISAVGAKDSEKAVAAFRDLCDLHGYSKDDEDA